MSSRKPSKPKEDWLRVEELEAKYVRLAIAMGHERRSRTKHCLPDKRSSINQQTFAEAIARQAPQEGVTRELLRDQIGQGAMRKSHQAALAAMCAGFSIEEKVWKNGSADDFMRWWEEWRARPTTPEAQNARLELVPGSREESFICERLASMWITLNQSAPGEPWPITGEISCFPSPLPREIAIKRAWLQFDGHGRCTIEHGVEIHEAQGKFGPVNLEWAGAGRRPICDLRAERGYLGRLSLPDNFCEAHGVTAGAVITARLAVFIKDIGPAGNDDGEPENGEAQRTEDSYSWYRPGHKTMGQATKDAILARIELLKEQKRHHALPGAPEGWIVVCETSRELKAVAVQSEDPE